MTIPKDFLPSDKAREIARPIRGCATDEQYVELCWRIDEELKRLNATVSRLKAEAADLTSEVEGR